MATDAVLNAFHPSVAGWFADRFAAPTAAQREAWPRIQAGENVLIAAPTGSGKTLAAFLASIDALVRRSVRGALPATTQVVYVSPLKALSTDIHDNLEAPLAGIGERLEAAGLLHQPLTAAVRTGDTTPAERDKMRRQPPHILVTTPESLYILLTSESGRAMLAGVGSVIVDEIHALAGSKRGAHLLLSLARLDALNSSPPVRIGLSATQKPIEAMAEFLCHQRPCRIIDTGHQRERDLRLEVTGSPLTAVMANEAWAEIYERLAQLVAEHDTTLIFVNTRRLAERATRHLGERLGEDAVMAHHGSLAREHRLEAEQRLKRGRLKAMVATASLELGIDIGDVDLVCQLGSPRSIAGFVQRVGRSGHAVGAIPKGRLFPLSLDDLVECTALIDALKRGELDVIGIPDKPLDVLAQQLVAEVAGREWDADALFERFRDNRAYRDLSREAFDQVLEMLASGFSTRRGRRSAYLHHDRIAGKLRARRGARLTALMNGGTIPDQFDYEVYLRPQDLKIGTLNEDFAFESLPGDIFQLGNTSYRILKIETGRVFVEDARGMPPNIPFWFGEAPGRTEELSDAVSRLRAEAQDRLKVGEELTGWLRGDLALPPAAASQLADYLAKAYAALGVLPTKHCLVLERFFDETADMHLVLHAPYGSRLNRALGLSLRKRFCRKFNFELQAAALEDSLVLSLGPTHSFPLDEVIGYLKADQVREVLIQALLDAPMFATRWRWAATVALAVRRMASGGKRPPQFQRSDSEDLIAVVFPDQLACQENLGAGREIPDHPLVTQAIDDCLNEVMDVVGLERLLRAIAAGEVRVETRDLVHPSPLSEEILNARPYAFLDDGAAEERRTANVRSLPHLSLEEAGSLRTLDPEAIAAVREQAWVDARDEDEMHDALLVSGFVTAAEVEAGEAGEGLFGWPAFLSGLARAGRAVRLEVADGHALWIATERLHEALAVYPGIERDGLPAPVAPIPAGEAALIELLRSRMEVLGPVTLDQLKFQFALPAGDLGVALVALEGEGMVVRGRFEGEAEQWCNRRLLARIHQATLRGRRRRYRPVDPARLMDFLFRFHGMIAREATGRASLEQVLKRLQGVSAPAQAWEGEILPARMQVYHAHWLDELCATGRYAWLRLRRPDAGTPGGAAVLGQTPVAILERPGVAFWRAPEAAEPPPLSPNAGRVVAVLERMGASFSGELAAETGLLETQLEQALAEAVAAGLIASDSFQGIRHLAARLRDRQRRARYRKRGYPTPGLEEAGRWALLRAPSEPVDHWVRCEHLARTLLDRYGVLFRALVANEPGLPSWRDLLYVCRRLEARDELAGGRFVEGFSGEQFALPAAVTELRRASPEGTWVVIGASDPLNLTGLITAGERVPALKSNRVAYRDGVPVAALVGGEIRALGDIELTWELRQRLIRDPNVRLHPPLGFGPSPQPPVTSSTPFSDRRLKKDF